MKTFSAQRSLLSTFGDLLSSIVLLLTAIIIGPLAFLRGPLQLERWFSYIVVLLPSSLFSQALRALIEWRFGFVDSAVVHLEIIVVECEKLVSAKPQSKMRRDILIDFYTLLARAYLHNGHMDDAMMVVQRCKKTLNLDSLPGLHRLDVKTAHLIRAGLAAGKLLEGTGLATMFVRSQQITEDVKKKSGAPKLPEKNSPERQGIAIAKKEVLHMEGTVIPLFKKTSPSESPVISEPL